MLTRDSDVGDFFDLYRMQMVILNVQGNGSFYLPAGGASSPVTASSIKEFVEAYKAGTLEKQQLKRG